jgi:uncharacterized protein (DUF433 family)
MSAALFGLRSRKVFMVEPRIVIRPEICHGKPVIAGTRIMVTNILGLLAGGYAIKQITEYYPDLNEASVIAAIHYTSAVLNGEKPSPST